MQEQGLDVKIQGKRDPRPTGNFEVVLKHPDVLDDATGKPKKMLLHSKKTRMSEGERYLTTPKEREQLLGKIRKILEAQ